MIRGVGGDSGESEGRTVRLGDGSVVTVGGTGLMWGEGEVR